jgi:hypothetical protein
MLDQETAPSPLGDTGLVNHLVAKIGRHYESGSQVN